MASSATKNIQKLFQSRLIMSILDPIDIQLHRGDRVMDLLQEREELIFELLGTVSANCVVTNRNLSNNICTLSAMQSNSLKSNEHPISSRNNIFNGIVSIL